MRWSWTKREAPPPAGVPGAAPAFEPIFPPRPVPAPVPAGAPAPEVREAEPVAAETEGAAPSVQATIGARLVGLAPDGPAPGELPMVPAATGGRASDGGVVAAASTEADAHVAGATGAGPWGAAPAAAMPTDLAAYGSAPGHLGLLDASPAEASRTDVPARDPVIMDAASGSASGDAAAAHAMAPAAFGSAPWTADQGAAGQIETRGAAGEAAEADPQRIGAEADALAGGAEAAAAADGGTPDRSTPNVGAPDTGAPNGHGHDGGIPDQSDPSQPSAVAPVPPGTNATPPGAEPPADGPAAPSPAEAGALLEALYPLLLRRALDEHGRRHYGAVLREHGIAGGLVPVLRSLLESEEHQGVAAQHAVDALLRRDVALGFGPVKHVISLGTSCYAAWLMQQCGLKRWSGPFDWLFGGVDMVVHCLEDDFASFLDADQLQALGDGRSTHRHYGPGITAGPVFNHRDVTLSEHRAYTERCVARFRAALAGTQSKCFVMVVAGDSSRPDSRLVGDFARLLAALSARTQGYRLLMVSHDQAEGGLASSLREVERRAEGSLFRFRSASAMQAGLSFRQEWDNLVLKRLLWSNRYDLRDLPLE